MRPDARITTINRKSLSLSSSSLITTNKQCHAIRYLRWETWIFVVIFLSIFSFIFATKSAEKLISFTLKIYLYIYIKMDRPHFSFSGNKWNNNDTNIISLLFGGWCVLGHNMTQHILFNLYRQKTICQPHTERYSMCFTFRRAEILWCCLFVCLFVCEPMKSVCAYLRVINKMTVTIFSYLSPHLNVGNTKNIWRWTRCGSFFFSIFFSFILIHCETSSVLCVR